MGGDLSPAYFSVLLSACLGTQLLFLQEAAGWWHFTVIPLALVWGWELSTPRNLSEAGAGSWYLLGNQRELDTC